MPAGWWKFAGHKWPVERVELNEGLLRIVVSCVATHNVPAGTAVGELYGADGALVFRNPDMPHADIWAGHAGSLVINFALPRLGTDGDMDEAAMDVALENLMAVENDTPVSTAEMMVTARRHWVFWRTVALPWGAIALGASSMLYGVPWWGGGLMVCAGPIAALVCNRMDREWWKK